MAGSITKEDREFVETWEHISPQRWGILRLDPRGDVRQEIVTGRREFKITTEERIISQDRTRKIADDPFLNGSFRPVIVPDSVTIETNPNALSDDEIDRILTSSDMAWTENLKTVNSVATIRRMMELAEDHDSVTIKRYRDLEARLLEVRGVVQLTVKDPALRSFLSDRPSVGGADANQVASGGANPRRRVGGMSKDYRTGS